MAPVLALSKEKIVWLPKKKSIQFKRSQKLQGRSICLSPYRDDFSSQYRPVPSMRPGPIKSIVTEALWLERNVGTLLSSMEASQ